MHLVLI
jgi:hypothetical protein